MTNLVSFMTRNRWWMAILVLGVVGVVVWILLSGKNQIVAHWVQLVPADKSESTDLLPFPALASVRVVVEGEASCPSIRLGDPLSSTMEMRERANPAREKFPVTVCEALLPRTDRKVKVTISDSRELTVPALIGGMKLGLIVVLGDTGCRGKDEDQNCDDPKEWPFKKLALAASGIGGQNSEQPDLVIHVGDYAYQWAGDKEDAVRDSWDIWNREFFQPAQPLLGVAPWVMVRGNHESCGRNSAQGWLLFMDHVSGRTIHCKDQDEGDRYFGLPYALDVTADLRIIVLDSANASKFVDESKDKFPKQFKAIYKDLSSKPGDQRRLWLLSHVPLLGCGRDKKNKPIEAWHPDRILNSALEDAKVDLPVDAIISGDLHMYQHVQSSELKLPSQLIVGHSGVQLDPPLDIKKDKNGRTVEELTPEIVKERCAKALGVADHTLTLQTKKGFGFAIIRRNKPSPWIFDSLSVKP